ncbi:hypothetical protein D3C71_1929930 [compost metagenome]
MNDPRITCLQLHGFSGALCRVELGLGLAGCFQIGIRDKLDPCVQGLDSRRGNGLSEQLKRHAIFLSHRDNGWEAACLEIGEIAFVLRVELPFAQ